MNGKMPLLTPLQPSELHWLENRIRHDSGLIGPARVAGCGNVRLSHFTELVGIVSSRCRTPCHHDPAWRNELCRAVRTLAPSCCLLIVDGTTTARFLRRAANRYDVPVLDLRLHRSRMPRKTAYNPAGEFLGTSPIASLHLVEVGGPRKRSRIPARDRWNLTLADRLSVLHRRPGGQLDQVLHELEMQGCQPLGCRNSRSVPCRKSPKIPGEVPRRTIPTKQSAKGRSCCRDDMPAKTFHHRGQDKNSDGSPRWVQSLQTGQMDSQAFLLHWTRACQEAWPDETEAEWIDRLLFDDAAPQPTPLLTLNRILQQQRLIASCQAIQGGVPVVCLTAMTIPQMLAHTCFRRHRMRWDGLPWGVALSKSRIESMGGRPVEYSNHREDSQRRNHREFWHQRERTASGIDWSIEQEWRVPHDINLAEFSDREALVFVPDRASAATVSRISRWPVVAIAEMPD